MSYAPKNTTVLNKLKKGEMTATANRLGYSLSYVSNVLYGRRQNTEITKAFQKLTGRRKAKA